MNKNNHNLSTYKAFVNTIIPITPKLAQKTSSIQEPGALTIHLEKYLIWSLDHLTPTRIHTDYDDTYVPLSESTARLLNIAAEQLVYMQLNLDPVNDSVYFTKGAFAAISPSDRLLAIAFLEQGKINWSLLPPHFQNHPEDINSIIIYLNNLTMFGYYSEWSGYGTTKLYPPNNRILEHFPIPWEQASYPGPSRGYHGLRGYLIENFI